MKINLLSLYIAALSLVKCEVVNYNKLAELDMQLSQCKGIDIREATIIGAQKRFFDNSWSSEDITRCYISRITAMNPALHSVLEVDPDALSQARALDKHLKDTGKLRGPLHGIPVLLKDSIGTIGRLNTTAGSYALLGTKPKQDATIVKRLRESGAVILGKTNLAEFSGMVRTFDGYDWSARGGQPKSAYSSRFPVSGSSSGSAVSVSANLCMVSIGADTLGSIITPAAYAMTVGLRASSGSISTKGVIPLIADLDMVGPITRTVEDNLIVARVIADPGLKETIGAIYRSSNDKPISPFSSDLVEGMRVGVIANLYHNSTTKAELISHDKLKENLGKKFQVEIVPGIQMDLGFDSNSFITMLIEGFNHGIAQYLKNDVTQADDKKIYSLGDIIEFNNKNNGTMKYGQASMVQVNSSAKGIDSEEFKNARKSFIETNEKKLEALFIENHLDAMIAPSTKFNDNSMTITSFAVGAGYPIMSIPIGMQDSGEPFGLSLVGAKGTEDKLLKLALAVERATTTPRTKPEFS